MLGRKITVLTALVLSGSSVAAIAQSASDVVVMRRPIAPPNRRSVTPTPTPAPSPTPTPVSTPTPTPVPTPSPTPDATPTPSPTPTPTPTSGKSYALVPFSARPVAGSWPLSGGKLSIDAAYDVRCVDTASGSQQDASNCSGMSAPSGARIFQIPATGNQLYRTIVISSADVLAGAPTVHNAELLCTSNVKIDGATWKLRCDPSYISGQYLWVATSASLPTVPVATSVSFLPAVSCFDAAMGSQVASTFCSNVPVGDATALVPVSSTFSRNLRTLAFSRDELLSALPMITNVATLCAQSQSLTDSGVTQSWKITCDADQVREHYRRVATTASKVSYQTVPLTGSGTWQVATHLTGIVCQDTDTNAAASDASKCDYMPNTSAMGYFDLPATFESQLRVLAIGWDTLIAQSPDLTNKAAFCASTASVYPGSSTASPVTYSVSCDPDATRMHYERYASTVGTAATSNNVLPLPDGFALTATGVKCRDTDTGSDVATTVCQYMTKGASEGLFRVPATYSIDLQTIALDYAALLSASPTKAAADAICSSSAYVKEVSANSASVVYSLSCNPEDVRNHYQSVARIMASATGSNNVLPLTQFAIMSSSTQCRDTDSAQTYKAAAVQSKCDNQSDTSGSAIKKVAAQVSTDLHVVNVAKADLLAAYPWATNADAFCNGAVANVRATSAGSNIAGYKMTCDNVEALRNHYRMSARTLTYSTASSNIIPFTGGFSITPSLSECRDTDSQTYKAAADQTRCDYLTDVTETGTKKVTMQYNAELWAITVSRAEIVAAYPWATNIDAFCSSSVLVREVSGGTAESWQLRCDNPESIRNHYALARRTLSTTTTSNNPVSFTGGYAFSTGTAECRDTDAGATYLKATDQTRCANLNDQTNVAGAVFRVPTASIDTPNKTVTVTKASILASSPYITGYPTVCGGKFNARNTSGAAETWTLICS